MVYDLLYVCQMSRRGIVGIGLTGIIYIYKLNIYILINCVYIFTVEYLYFNLGMFPSGKRKKSTRNCGSRYFKPF